MDIQQLTNEVMARLDELATYSEDPYGLTRVFLSPEQKRVSELVLGWMKEAGMEAWIDGIGNVIGRYEGISSGLPALMLGSHLDTVRNAGKYDGPLGVVTAIACVKALHQRQERLPFAIEVVGFSDEEGTRFHATLLGSRAMAGTFDYTVLQNVDDKGISMADAMRSYGLDPDKIVQVARRPADLLAYVELHIEQGPVLEAEGLPVGIVTSIAGATRLMVTLTGRAGHAGTVPMSLRRDALVAAAEAILFIEKRCLGKMGGPIDNLVGTVGQIQVLPGASNVIPGTAKFSVDVRAPTDSGRLEAVRDIVKAIQDICSRRRIEYEIRKVHENPSTACAPWLMTQLEAAIVAEGFQPRYLPSGAGHDAIAMAAIVDIGMLFIRCKGGISHTPDESIAPEDVKIGIRVLLRFIRQFKPRVRCP
jgi:allantoate deiminase